MYSLWFVILLVFQSVSVFVLSIVDVETLRPPLARFSGVMYVAFLRIIASAQSRFLFQSAASDSSRGNTPSNRNSKRSISVLFKMDIDPIF